MDSTSFKLGVMIFASMLIVNLFHVLFCKIYKIRIENFTIFYSPWFYISEEKINHTKFRLGWFPMGLSLKLFGTNLSQESLASLTADERNVALSTKPKFLKWLFEVLPSIIFVLITIASITLFSNEFDLTNQVEEISNILLISFNGMFGDKTSIASLDILMKQYENNVDRLFLLFSVLMVLISSLNVLTEIVVLIGRFINLSKKFRTYIEETIGFVLIWFFCWKLPSFAFSVWSFKEIVFLFLSFFFGFVLSGLVVFYIVVFVGKVMNKVKKSEV